jgi:hypothetical protein
MIFCGIRISVKKRKFNIYNDNEYKKYNAMWLKTWRLIEGNKRALEALEMTIYEDSMKR